MAFDHEMSLSLSPAAQMLLRLRLQQLRRALFRTFGEARYYIGPPKLAFRLNKDGNSSGFQEPDTYRQTKQGRYSRFLLFLIPDIVRHMPARQRQHNLGNQSRLYAEESGYNRTTREKILYLFHWIIPLILFIRFVTYSWSIDPLVSRLYAMPTN